MTPVMQSKLFCKDGIHSGNCYAACLASLLDLPLWMVPPFEDMFASHNWSARIDAWLARFFGLREEVVWEDDEGIPDGPHLAWGPSARGVSHMVIYQGDTLLHDPHPSGSGIKKVEGRKILVKIDPAPLSMEKNEMMIEGHNIEEAAKRGPLTEAQIKHMVNRFLGWRLPENFFPDGGISFKPTFNEHTDHPQQHEPTGTNLFDGGQAQAMVRYMLEGMPPD